MLRNVSLIVVSGFLIVGLAAPALGRDAVSAQAHEAPIVLKVDSFVPTRGEEPEIPSSLRISGYPSGQRGYYIVQFAGPILDTWKDQVEATGATLLDYIPDFAFKVRMTPQQAEAVRELPDIVWVGPFHPAFKLSPDLRRDGVHLYTVQIERGADAGRAQSEITGRGAQVLRRQGSLLLVAANSSQLDALAHIADVAWIQNFEFRETHNEYGAGVIMGANTANALGYDGSTQTVAVADTGLGGGTPLTAHPDIPAGRLTAIYDWPAASAVGCYNAIPDGAIDVDSGHGSHTAGSVLSDGGASGEGRGTAPAAHLIFQAVEDFADMIGICAVQYPDGYYLIGLPEDLRPLFQQAYDGGARIHSNSWGSDAQGDYTLDSANTDDFIWDHPDMTITFSAGNAGVDGNADGVIDNGSTGSPATAKNVITVGASEDDRDGHYDCDAALSYNSCAAQSGQNDIFTYGQAWPGDYPVNPIANDPSAGNAEQMAAFSSRGPTDDGRIKPDVVAPGTWVLSGYSDLYQEGYDGSPNPQNGLFQYDGWGFPLNQGYKYMGGTSMSNPLTAGGAAVVRDFYQQDFGHPASAALVKATLINSAVDMLDENNDGANDNDFPIPNSHEGWGRVNLANATDGSHEYFDVATGLSTNSTDTYTFNIGSGGSPFKVTLVWTDYPSTATASTNLVNDLNLTVTAPDGNTVFVGNLFSGGWSTTDRGRPDRRNNVENVYIQSADAGTWTVDISGYNVPNGPQPYALVVDGGATGPTPTPTETPTGGPTLTPTATNTPGGHSTPTPTSPPGSTPTPTSPPGSTPTPTSPPGSTPTATQITGESMHVGDLDGSTTSQETSWSALVTITIHDGAHSPVANATVRGSWSGGVSGSGLCNTDSSGQCQIGLSGISNRRSSATFTVNNVTHSSYFYAVGSNHDPDGDSDGTEIIVPKP